MVKTEDETHRATAATTSSSGHKQSGQSDSITPPPRPSKTTTMTMMMIIPFLLNTLQGNWWMDGGATSRLLSSIYLNLVRFCNNTQNTKREETWRIKCRQDNLVGISEMK